MIRGWQWRLLESSRRLWVRTVLISVLGVVTAIAAILLDPLIPSGVEDRIGARSVSRILDILATSMLTITTFSLTTMVAAYVAATSSVTPRATKLLMADPTTQNVLATFVGTFVFSMVGIIVLSMDAYGAGGRVVLFVVTLLLILIVIAALLRWIDHLTRLGRVNETTKIVEEATATALRDRRARPYLGGAPLIDPERDVPKDARPVFAAEIGYVKHVDLELLNQLADEAGAAIYLTAIPGEFAHRASPLLCIAGGAIDGDALREAFTVDDERTYDQDPRYGLAVMAEIASRALSPAVNDPGTAIDVLSRCVRLLAIWCETPDDPEPRQVLYPKVHVPEVALDECFDDVFTPIGRDGASMVEVQIHLQKALAALAAMGTEAGDGRFHKNAERHALQALQRAAEAMTAPADRTRIMKAACLVSPAVAHSWMFEEEEGAGAKRA